MYARLESSWKNAKANTDRGLNPIAAKVAIISLFPLPIATGKSCARANVARRVIFLAKDKRGIWEEASLPHKIIQSIISILAELKTIDDNEWKYFSIHASCL